ncbi:MAG: glycosyltransferase [Chloroflexi bacterium]|nr:glycosyltransferase [Chloroflexota bacterium]MCI0883080.1 glycosyltransferase [Chloroflexota bacterium]
MSTPKVSVVIPTYNRAHLIGETLESVLAQTFSDYEIVVVDDGSIDDTRSVVARVAPQARYIYQKNTGIPEVLNVCVRAARGEYIQHLGSDDVLIDDTLARSVALLDAHPDVALVHGAAWLIDGESKRLSISRPTFATGDYIRSGREEIRDLLFSNHIVAPTVMVRRQVMLETGLFDGRFGLYEDWNLWTRIAKKHDIAYSHEPLVNYRVHSGPSGSIFHTASTHDIDLYRGMHLDEVLNDPSLRDVYAGVRRKAMALHHMVVANRGCETGEMWYARRSAIKAAFAHPSAVPSATRLFARTLAPTPLVNFVRRRREKRAHEAATPGATTQELPE